MSQTELYIIRMNGDLEFFRGFGNSHRGASLFWHNLSDKYLNIPYAKIMSTNNKKELEKLWRLDRDPNIPREIRILHISTFDRMMIKKENLQQFINAIKRVIEIWYIEDLGHFTKYPSVFLEILDYVDCIGIAWNQTSVNHGYWDMYEECPTCGEHSIERSYNIFKDNKHQFLFEYLEGIE